MCASQRGGLRIAWKTMPTTADSGSIESNYFLMTRVARARTTNFYLLSCRLHRLKNENQDNTTHSKSCARAQVHNAKRCARNTPNNIFFHRHRRRLLTRDRSVHFNPRLNRIPRIILAMGKNCLFFICVIYSRLSIPPKLSCHCLRGDTIRAFNE